MAIRVRQMHLKEIELEGERIFPYECCGFLVGAGSPNKRDVAEIVPTVNAREDAARNHRFLITPESFLLTEKTARSKSLDIIGFYHSHPNAPARPSAFDTEQAWPWYSYLIVSIINGNAQESTSWTLADNRSTFHQEELIIIP